MNPLKETKTEDSTEIKPVGISGSWSVNTNRKYYVSRGKASHYKKALLFFFLAIIITAISMIHLTFNPLKDPYWMEYLLWLPRLASIIFTVVAVLKMKEATRIKPFLSFDSEGIEYENQLHSWQSIKSIKVRQTIYTEKEFTLILELQEHLKEIDITKIDEFSEDVAVILTRYFKKYNLREPKETILNC